MADDLRSDLIRHFLEDARVAARARDWDQVLDLAEDVLVLDGDNADALALRTLAERHADHDYPDRGRRHETVVFADLVGSTEMANRFDPELVRRVTLEYERICSPVLSALGGHVHRFVGDGILASFGYPTSHEDDAQRAVQAALDLVEAVSRTSTAHRHLGIQLQVRVGVASGVLVHADRGSGTWSQPGDLFGPAVNLAARIHELAEPGQVCVSDETANLVAGFFEFSPLGPHQLKGFDKPIEVHRVVGRTRATGWLDRLGRAPSPFVGRSLELERLGSIWSSVRQFPDAPGRTVHIAGDPGVGKSRIIRELLEVSADGDPGVVELRCSAYRVTSPLHPVRSALERYAGFEADDDDQARTSKLAEILEANGVVAEEALPYLTLLLDVDPGPDVARPESSPVQVREVTLTQLQRLITAVAASSPTMLVVEDIHWSDPSTRELLLRVVRSRPPGLLILMTSRAAPEWLIDVELETLALGPLTPVETRALVRAVSDTSVPDRVVDEIAWRSDGIPLFVEQLADDLATWNPAPSDDDRIPATLADLLQARLDGAGSSKRVAQIAAIVGREFEPALVEAVVQRLRGEGRLDRLERPVREHLDRLLESRLIEPDEARPGRLRFHHALVGQAAYESQLHTERPERHEAVARVLVEEGTAGRAADPAMVAYHFDEAGLGAEAIGQYLAAANREQALGAYDEVLAHLSRANDLVPGLSAIERPPLELAVRLSRGAATSAIGGYAAPQAVDDFQRALDVCQDLRDVPGMGLGMQRALLGLWGFYCGSGDLATARTISNAMAEQAEHLERLDEPGLPGARPGFHACRGVELFFAGSLAPSREHLELAVEQLAVDDIDPAQWPLPNDPLAAVLGFLAVLRVLAGDEEGALAAAQRGIARSLELDFPIGPFSLGFVRNYEAWMHRARGALDDAAFAAAEVSRVGERHGFFDWLIVGRIHLAAAAAAQEPSLAALAELGGGIDTWRAGGGEVMLPWLMIEQAWGYVALGETDRAKDRLEEATELIERGQWLFAAEAHRLRAELTALTSGPADPAVTAELTAGMRFAAEQGAPLFVQRCAGSYERWFGASAMPPDLRRLADVAADSFGGASPGPEGVRQSAQPV